MSLTETFIRLCELTTPHGHEAACWHLVPPGTNGSWYVDSDDNLHVRVGKSRIMWSCHLDTACSLVDRIKLVRNGNFIETDGKTILGADDKIGAAIMIKMIEAGVPGWYVFHAGEERGRKGSDALARSMAWHINQRKPILMPDICIAFDRRGYEDVITHQIGRRTCSDEFATALAAILNKEAEFKYKPCPHGAFTDSYSYSRLISECTNLSVGYDGHHTHLERQDMKFANLLLKVILDNRDLIEALPATRDPDKEEQKPQYPFAGQRWDEESNGWVNQYNTGDGTHGAAYPNQSGTRRDTTSGSSSIMGEWPSGGGRNGMRYPSKAAKKAAKRARREERLARTQHSTSTQHGPASTPSDRSIVRTSDDLDQLIGDGPYKNEWAKRDTDLFSEKEYKREVEGPSHNDRASWYFCPKCKEVRKSYIALYGAVANCFRCGSVLPITIYKYDADQGLFIPVVDPNNVNDVYAPHELPFPAHP